MFFGNYEWSTPRFARIRWLVDVVNIRTQGLRAKLSEKAASRTVSRVVLGMAKEDFLRLKKKANRSLPFLNDFFAY
jgi:hypothetical protein